MPPNAMGALVVRLLDALAVTESLPVRMSAGPTSAAASRDGGANGAGDGLSALARPFKLRLGRAPN